MKKTITILSLMFITLNMSSQSFVETFENYTLSDSTAYTSTLSVPFHDTCAFFQHDWDTAFHYWSGGFTYTNFYDSATAGSGNLYGVKPFKGYNLSNKYVVGQNRGLIKMKAPYRGVEGFYLTNTTYDYKSMRYGDSFAKKFGGTTGNDPDWFKITIKGYLNGAMRTDSVEFYLADYRFTNNSLDYIVNSWQYVNTTALAEVDSIRFFMYSSDVGSFGINTPLFFGLDNFTASPSFVGLKENSMNNLVSAYPNPVKNELTLNKTDKSDLTIQLMNINGVILKEEKLSTATTKWDLTNYSQGVYLIRFSDEHSSYVKKLIKE